MQSGRQRSVQSCIAFILSCISSACWLLPVDPAPTLEAKESPELLSRASGTIVVADGAPRLLIVSLPGGQIDEFATEGDAIVASGLDEGGLVAFVRKTTSNIFTDDHYALVIKSLATGEERVLKEVGRSDRSPSMEFIVDLASGRALCSFRGRKARLFEIATGRELEVPGWQTSFSVSRLSRDGKSLLGKDERANPWGPDRWVSIDILTGSMTLLGNGVRAFDPNGKVVQVSARPFFGSRSDLWVEEAQRRTGLLGCTFMPCTFLSSDLAIYEGLASPTSKPRNHFSQLYPSFERSIRLGDVATQETVTLVPRFGRGSFVYSRFALPVASH